MIAVLYAEPQGCYSELPDVDLWDEQRDARLYAGPWAVVAHPPCARWCRLAGFVEARYGYLRGEDDGCFASALAAVRQWGGVLEHPAYSDAWAAHDLNRPPFGGGWINADMVGGWTCYVEQGRYGHRAKKATWIYACGVDELPLLRWGGRSNSCAGAVRWRIGQPRKEVLVSRCSSHTRALSGRPRLGKREASATPLEFRDVLLAIARSAGGAP